MVPPCRLRVTARPLQTHPRAAPAALQQTPKPLLLPQAGIRPPRTLFTPQLRVGRMHPRHQQGWGPPLALREQSWGHPIAAIKGQLRRKTPTSLLSLVPWYRGWGGAVPQTPAFPGGNVSAQPQRTGKGGHKAATAREQRTEKKGSTDTAFNQATLTGQMRGGHTHAAVTGGGTGTPTPLPRVPLPGVISAAKPSTGSGPERGGSCQLLGWDDDRVENEGLKLIILWWRLRPSSSCPAPGAPRGWVSCRTPVAVARHPAALRGSADVSDGETEARGG